MRRPASIVFALPGLLFLASCITGPPPVPPVVERPPDAGISRGAGKGDAIYVTLRLGGRQDLLFLLDTGTTCTVLDTSLAPGLGKPLGHATMRDGVNGEKLRLNYYKAPALALGGVPLVTGRVAVAHDLSMIREATGAPVMGVLGMDCLRNYCLQIDFERGQLRFLDPDLPPDPGRGTEFILKCPSDGLPAIETNLLGVPKISTLIDTGNDASGDLNEALVRRAYGDQNMFVARGLDWSATGAHAGSAGRFTNCALGGETYNLVLSRASDTSLGLKFLANHLVTLDFPRNRLYLKRRSDRPVADEASMSGISVMIKNKEPVVVAVDADSPAATADIQKGDVFTEIDGRAADLFQLWEIRELFRSGDGRVVLLTRQRGGALERIKLVLKRRI